jgi:hypothetical protein
MFSFFGKNLSQIFFIVRLDFLIKLEKGDGPFLLAFGETHNNEFYCSPLFFPNRRSNVGGFYFPEYFIFSIYRKI